MPNSLQTLDVRKLFGYLDHIVTFRAGSPTIITGPNGSGKTYLLRILRALARVEPAELLALPFETAQVTYLGGHRLAATRLDEDVPIIELAGFSGAHALGTLTVTAEDSDFEGMPPWVERAGPDAWWDSETNEILTIGEVARRYGGSRRRDLFAEFAWLHTFAPSAEPIFIETGRLDSSPLSFRPRRHGSASARRRPDVVPIERYVGHVRDQISTARRRSLSVTQRADKQFAARALDRARATVQESVLRQRYQALSDLHQELHDNGLTDETIDVELPGQRTNPTERRILDVFLEDWKQKLDPLLPVHEKLNALRAIIDPKLTRKRLMIQSDGDIAFDTPSRKISVTLLSSGEQHLLALFTMFLFSADAGALVLIDEPEISLHAAWKHAFLEDLQTVVSLIPVQIVLATHSSALINSRWELVEELEA